MGLLDRARSLVGLQTKKTTDGPLPHVWPQNWFQLGWRPPSAGTTSVVEACVSSYAQTVAQCPGHHYRVDEMGTRLVQSESPVTKILDRPNSFQTRSDFLLNLVYQLLYTGNAYWIGNGDTPRTHTEIYLLDSRVTRGHRIAETNDIVYSTGGEFAEISDFPMIDGQAMIPSRYIGHVRLFTPRDPLVGVTPIQAAAGAVAVNSAITTSQAAFFENMSRPSGVLQTDIDLNREQMEMLREAWEARAKGLNAGEVPILSSGLKWQPLSITSQDAELVEAWKMSVEDISRVFRVPLPLINRMEESTFNNAETMMQWWLASGLGFLVDHIELAMKSFFGLPQSHGVHLDTESLLRTDMSARFQALGEGVTKGILSPNEARNREGLPPVEGGDEPRVQQQMVGLSWTPDQDQPQAPLPTEADDEPEVDVEASFVSDFEKRMAA